MAKKSCKKGYYYCNTDEKCKKIPKGYHIMPTGYLMKDSAHKEDEKEETKKKNGNGTNGNGNGNGDSSGSSDGGGVSEAWSAKYKRSIDCDNPRGFSQRAHCQGRKKVNEAKKYGGDHEVSMAKSQVKKSQENLNKIKKALRGKTDKDNLPAWLQAKLTDTEHNTDAAAGYMDEALSKKDKLKEISKQLAGASKMHAQQSKKVAQVANELEEARKSGDYSLRDWFTKSRASDGTPGWVQLGGKYAGKPCAKQPGQKTKPKCGSSKMARNLTDKEEESAFRRKNAKDPNPNRKGAPINVATEKKKKLNASYSDWRSDLEQLDELKCWKGYKRKRGSIPGEKGSCVKEGKQYQVGDTIPDSATKPKSKPTGAARYKFGVDKTGLEGPENPLKEGKKDACYKKVKARYKVWPSAYASGALVKCRKVGAANWGNSTNEGYEFSNWRDDFQALEFETINIIEAKPLKKKSKVKIKRWWDDDGDGIGWEKGEVKEDWQKANRKDGVDGMSQSSVDAYRRENPGSKLQTAVTEKNPTGKRKDRRKNFCSRSNGQRKMHNIDCSKTPEKKICKARKRWRC